MMDKLFLIIMDKLFLIIRESPLLLWASLLFFLCAIPFIKLPIFLADYWFSKWVIIYIATIVFAILICGKKTTIILPKFTPFVNLGLGVLVVLTGFNHYLNNVPLLCPAFWDRLCFVFLSLSFFNIFKQNQSFIRILLSVLFIANALFILFCLPNFYKYIFSGSKDLTLLHQNFGNINMSAEFVEICLILLISGRQYFPKLGRIIDTLIYFSITYCYYASSRSIALAFFFSILILLWLKIISLKKIAEYFIVSSLIIICIGLLIYQFLPADHIKQFLPADYIKQGSTFCRWQIIMCTLKMIIDHPFGVGPGNYLFSFIPYISGAMPLLNETNIVQTPHNEYLRIIVEDGIPFTVILVGTFIVYLFNYKNRLRSIALTHPTIIGYFSFLIVQAAFQFPLVNAFPFLITACFVGYILSIFHETQVIYLCTNKWIFSSTIVGCMVLGGMTSEALSFLYSYSAPLNKIAYKLNGHNWQAAVQAARADLAEGNFVAAHQTINRELQIHPHNFIAISVKAQLESQAGNSEDCCLLLKKIDDYFMNQSSYHSYIIQNCSKPDLLSLF